MWKKKSVNVAQAVVEVKGICVGGRKGMTPGSSTRGSFVGISGGCWWS